MALNAVFVHGQGSPDRGWVTVPEDGFTAPAHRGAVNAVVTDEAGLILTAGEDGFIGFWDGETMRARERFQASRVPIKRMAARPGRNEVAVYETDGLGFHRVSVWDYAEKTRLFSLSFNDAALFCGYTANGKYLVLGFVDGVSLFDGKNGKRHGEALGGYPVTFAVSNATERTLQTYSPSGTLAYWDIDRLTLSRSVSVQPNLQQPLVFGNYRFLAGQGGGELFVIDAVSGRILYQTPSVPGALLCADISEASFSRLSAGAEGLEREDFTVGAGGVQRAGAVINMEAEFSAAAPLDGELALLGRADGRLALAGRARDGADVAAFFSFKNQRRLSDAAASADGGIAFTDGNGGGGYIPAGFTGQPDAITLFDARGANRVTADGAGEKTFLFWQDGTAGAPFVKTFGGTAPSDTAPDETAVPPPGRIRSADIYGGRVMFLDVSGGITVSWPDGGRPAFSYASALPLDAAFVNDRRFLIARNAETPFLLVDCVSGETLPAAYPASMSFMLHRSRRNGIFCAVLRSVERQAVTEVIKFDAASPQESPVIFSYPEEDTDFSFIEYGAAGGRYAATAGGEGAFIVSGGGLTYIDRTPALPQKLLPLDGAFAALDGDGSIAWYDGASGKLLAMFRLYEDEWLLSSRLSLHAKPLRGSVPSVSFAVP